ncbi:amiloride-sensitive cation channel 1, neuronal [Elysia marginata]|uniref:Amiloride-sensitive cation channel 1, neuronal n=1 Tax=Elysia marginata TaxID=1093978 RepID=A0AAV4H1J1_9GAST|nr:amiloride-sensitive cation channel 1, neuronal [Elysia marginata]
MMDEKFKRNLVRPVGYWDLDFVERKQIPTAHVPSVIANPMNSETEKGQELKDSSIIEHLKLYQESATIHGVSMLSAPQLYFCRRFLWTILVIVMSVVLALTLYKQISELNKYPIKTVTASPLYSQLAFPAVTICNINQYIKGRVSDDPMVPGLLQTSSIMSFQSSLLSAVLRKS